MTEEVTQTCKEAVETLAHRFYDAARPDCAIPYCVAERLAALAHLPTDLSEENAKLREALELIIPLLRATDELQANSFADDAVKIARTALGDTQ